MGMKQIVALAIGLDVSITAEDPLREVLRGDALASQGPYMAGSLHKLKDGIPARLQ